MSTPLLNLPPRLKLLYEKSDHHPAADLAQQSFLPWLDNFTKPLTFFPEYTDHGRPHLESGITYLTQSPQINSSPPPKIMLHPATATPTRSTALMPLRAVHTQK